METRVNLAVLQGAVGTDGRRCLWKRRQMQPILSSLEAASLSSMTNDCLSDELRASVPMCN